MRKVEMTIQIGEDIKRYFQICADGLETTPGALIEEFIQEMLTDPEFAVKFLERNKEVK